MEREHSFRLFSFRNLSGHGKHFTAGQYEGGHAVPFMGLSSFQRLHDYKLTWLSITSSQPAQTFVLQRSSLKKLLVFSHVLRPYLKEGFPFTLVVRGNLEQKLPFSSLEKLWKLEFRKSCLFGIRVSRV